MRASAQEALSAARKTGALIASRLQQEVGPQVKFRGVQVTKLVGKTGPRGVASTVDGTLELPLPEELDLWQRVALKVKLVDATARLSAELTEGDEPTTNFEAPQARVVDPEAYRAQLIARWVERARAFAEAAQAPNSPLAIVDCEVPGAVRQQSVSMDEVRPTLELSCRIDAPAAVRPPPPPIERH